MASFLSALNTDATATAARARIACGCRSRSSRRAARGRRPTSSSAAAISATMHRRRQHARRRGAIRRRVRARPGMDFLSLSRGGKFEDAKQPQVGWAAYPYTGPSGWECMPTTLADARGPFGRNVAAQPARFARGPRAGFDDAGRRHRRHRHVRQAEAILARGEADIVGAARQSLADPDWFLKIRLGRGAEVRRCDVHELLRGARPEAQAGHVQAVGPRRPRRARRQRSRRRHAAADRALGDEDRAMRITIVGGGPAGLYFAILMKRLDPRPRHRDLRARRPARHIRLGHRLLRSDLRLSCGQRRPSFRRLSRVRDLGQRRRRAPRRDIVHPGQSLLGHRAPRVSQHPAGALRGARRRAPVPHARCATPIALPEADLLVGADGANSIVRARFADAFQPSLAHGRNKYIWLGTRGCFTA